MQHRHPVSASRNRIRFKPGWFLPALLLMVPAAWLWPEGGTGQLPELTGYGVSVIFFFYGLKLHPSKLKAGLGNWKLHALIQGSTFILFPLLVLAFRPAFQSESGQLVWLGIFFLSALPSTVSSSVVMVALVGGNIPAAIFNASLSSIAGVFLTPLWMGLILAGTSVSDSDEIILKLFLQVLAPVAIGMLLNRYWGKFAEKHDKKLRYFDQVVILLIVYTSFCESFERRMFDHFSAFDLAALCAGMAALFFLVYLIIGLVAKRLRLSPEDRICALFCGSKKSLVHGTVMVSVLFPGSEITGLLLLPLMLYHALQLTASGIIAGKIRAQLEK